MERPSHDAVGTGVRFVSYVPGQTYLTKAQLPQTGDKNEIFEKIDLLSFDYEADAKERPHTCG